MRFTTIIAAAVTAVLAYAAPSDLAERQTSPFAGYLISTFSDPNPRVQMWLSDGNSPTKFSQLNAGKEVLASDVGTKGVRDIYLTSNTARSQWYIIATGTFHLPPNHEHPH